jgi:hypothetical protein
VEHRWGQRKEVRQRVRVVLAGAIAAQGQVANVSISGAFVRTLLPAPVLSIVQIAFVADDDRRSLASGTVAAQVVRRTPEGLGLEWCDQVPKIVDVLAITSVVAAMPKT